MTKDTFLSALDSGTNTEQRRRECEAREVIRRWGEGKSEERKAFYVGVFKKRGAAAANELMAEVKRQWALLTEGK